MPKHVKNYYMFYLVGEKDELMILDRTGAIGERDNYDYIYHVNPEYLENFSITDRDYGTKRTFSQISLGEDYNTEYHKYQTGKLCSHDDICMDIGRNYGNRNRTVIKTFLEALGEVEEKMRRYVLVYVTYKEA